MTTLNDGRVLLGFETFIPPRLPTPDGHAEVDVGYGHVEAGAWYLVRHPDRRYDLRQVTLPSPATRPALVATRAIAVSPFPDGAALYFGGYDANKAPTHNTAWIARASIEAAVGRQ